MNASRRAAGFSLIEVMIATSVLAVMMAGASSTLGVVWRHNQLMREEASALRAADSMLAQIRAASLGVYGLMGVEAAYGEPSPGVPYTFAVQLLRGHQASMGVDGAPEGKVLLIMDETPDESDYGVDLNGDGDAVDTLSSTGSLLLFPLDLDGSGTFGDVVAPGDLQLLPVVVIMRWNSLAGGLEGRVQLMTIIGE